ncbi:MAG TPA: hypothetical protein V6C46_09485, partial [Coleofasciculaceae cyanobacterium]
MLRPIRRDLLPATVVGLALLSAIPSLIAASLVYARLPQAAIQTALGQPRTKESYMQQVQNLAEQENWEGAVAFTIGRALAQQGKRQEALIQPRQATDLSISVIAATSGQKSQSQTADLLLETALRVSPLDLAKSYLAVQTLMDFLAFAELGVKIQTPIWPKPI